ncbi:MAG TPA: hypothetical protein VK911_12565 [Vicinamibacterales bacterium]|nr:hypothetical protein [Vicinamibacterales bacterium]
MKPAALALLTALLVLPSPAAAQRPAIDATWIFEVPPVRPLPPGQRAEPVADPYEDKVVETAHMVRIGGQEVRYTAAAGSIPLRDGAGKGLAHVFFVAYTRDGAGDPATRPITFAFNGGPGSASIWLHMGALGPRRVEMSGDGFQPAPPFKLVDNAFSILDVTDLVMIDPVSTGYSRAAAGQDPKLFHGSSPDIQAVAEFIRTYTTRYRRWPSPKYLLGESYGTTRSAGLSAELQQRHGIELNGIILVSAVVDFGSQEYAPGHDLAYCTYLPTLTATAWYHKKLPTELQGDLQKAIAEAKAFALGDYMLALARGNRLTDAERRAVAARLARYTGLSPEFILRSHLRVTDARFRKELLRDQGVMVGRLDGRYTGLDADAAGERQEFDPSNSALQGAYTAMFSEYVRRELKYENDVKYETSGPVRPWSYAEFQNRYVNMMEPLRSAMARNPYLKVLVANGYYDMATPFFSTEYTFDHIGFESTYRDRVTMTFYEAGHMMYIRPSMLEQFKKDIAAFIE